MQGGATEVTCSHVYHGPSPAAMEAGDAARKCRECGWRERAIVLPYIPPGSNEIHRMHYLQVAKWRAQVGGDVAKLMLGESGEPLERARITLDARWKDKRRHDPSNIVEGLKSAVDALIGHWIVDDDAEHVEGAEFAKDTLVHAFVAEHLEHPGRQFVRAVGACGLANHPLVSGQLLVEEERVTPVKARFRRGLGGHSLY